MANLQEHLKQFWESFLPTTNVQAVGIQPTKSILGKIGIFKQQAITVNANETHPWGIIEDTTSGEKCAHNAYSIIELFNKAASRGFAPIKNCLESEGMGELPFTHCGSKLYFGRNRPKGYESLRDNNHLNWHFPKYSPLHTHIFKVNEDGTDLGVLSEADVRCVLNTYREAANKNIIDGNIVANMHANKPIIIANKFLKIEKLTADHLISEDDINKLCELYKELPQKIENLSKKMAEQSIVAFIEAFLLVLISELMRRYFIPMIKYREKTGSASDKYIDDVMLGMQMTMPFILMANQTYRLFSAINFGAVGIVSSALMTMKNLLVHTFSLDKKMPAIFSSANHLINFFSIYALGPRKDAEEAFSKLLGFEAGAFTATLGMDVANKLVTQMIACLPKLKPEDASQEATQDRALPDTLRRRRN